MHAATHHTMPVETTAGGIGFAAAKYGLLAKLGAIFAAGSVGATFIALFQSKTKRETFIRASIAGPLSVFLAFPAYKLLIGFVPILTPAAEEEFVLTLLSVAFVLGGLSWGIVGAMAALSGLMQNHGGPAIWARLGLATKNQSDASTPQ